MAGKKKNTEIYQDRKGEWRWRMTGADGEVLGAACEGYSSKADCEKNARRGKNAKDSWEFYEDRAGKWRWRRKASNGKIVGAASHGFPEKSEAEENATIHGYAG